MAQRKIKKHVKALTYAPKISAVRSGDCRQTIREGDSVTVGDEILFHGWESRPYHSRWSWRLRVTVTEAIPIMVDYYKGIGVFDQREDRYIWYVWDCTQINDLAKKDNIDPPIGLALRDVLFGFGRKQTIMPMQIIRW